MEQTILFFEFVFIFFGAVFLSLSVSPIRKLIAELEEDELKKSWKVLIILIFFFIPCYAVFGYNLSDISEVVNLMPMIISLMLLCGGIFCYLVGKLALRTMNDIKRLSMFQQESVTDGLMGIKNRRYFDQKIIEEVTLAQRYKIPLSVIMLDVDHFKKINDIYGHKIGDEVLKNLSGLILEVVRDTDIVARYGGEEIAIITPSCGKQEAALLAERLREIIEKTTMVTVGSTQEVIQVTVSMGVCAMSHMITDKEALIEEADSALYLAKKQGRNRVICSNW